MKFNTFEKQNIWLFFDNIYLVVETNKNKIAFYHFMRQLTLYILFF
jgi:hypothetical protein